MRRNPQLTDSATASPLPRERGLRAGSGYRSSDAPRSRAGQPEASRATPNACHTLLVAGLLLLSSITPGWSQPPPAKPDTNAVDTSTFSDVVARDRNWQRLLTNAAELLQANDTTRGIDLLQRCFSAPEDGYVLRPEWELPAARGIAAQLLRNAGPATWKAYEAQYGAVARQALDRIETEGPPGAYQSLIRQYGNTQAGATALDRLANWHLGRGDYEAAVNCWELLLSNPVHASRITAVHRLKLYFAASRAGRREIASREAELLGQNRVALGGQSLGAAEWRSRLERLPAVLSPAGFDWKLLGGSAERNRVSVGSTPFLLRPSITVSMFDAGPRTGLSRDDLTMVREGRLQYEKELENSFASGTAMGFAGTPITQGNLIIWRDAFNLRAVDRETRRTVWTYPTATRLHSLLKSPDEAEPRNRAAQPTYRQNSILDQITSDGQRVYFIDDNFIPDRPNAQFLFDQGELPVRPDGKAAVGPWNRMVAVELQGATDKRSAAWSLGGQGTADASAPLLGHYFLGPPLPIGGMLYCTTEYQKQIWLVAVHPDSGRVEWRQTISLAPVPSREAPLPPDRLRLSQANLLAGARGIIVCPVGSGILVGVDQITGDIAWAFDYRTRRKGPAFQYGNVGHNSFEQFNEGDFPSPPLIYQERVYFLAPGDVSSDQVVCLNLKTGRKIWQVEAPDLKYLANVNDELLVGVGGTDVIGLSVQAGTTAWTRRVPRISGIGAALPGVYLLPLADGRVLSLDLRQGTEIGVAMQAPDIRPGNLVVSGQDVLSLNGLDLQVFPQSSELLARLEAQPESQRNTYQFWMELGELQFRMGQVVPAKASVLKALSLAQPGSQTGIRSLLRELVWHDLQHQPEQRTAMLAEYAEYCETPEQRAQYLLLKGEEQIRRGELQPARQTARQLLELNQTEPLRLLSDTDRQVTPQVWIAELSERVKNQSNLENNLLPGEAAPEKLLQQGDREALSQYLLQHPHGPRSAEIRLALARQMIQNGQLQAAELLLWEDHQGTDPAALAASQLLLNLYESVGLYEESGLLLHQIGTRLTAVQGPEGRTGHDVYSQYPRTSLAWSAAQRFVPPDWDIENIHIDEQHEVDLKLRNTFNSAPRYLHFPHSSQHLVVRGQTLSSTLQQVDSETGTVVADITLPSAGASGFFPFFDTRHRLGHFLPLGGAANCYGVSLLERGLSWHQSSTPQLRLNSLVRVGPCTPQVCVFRTRDRLLGLSPSTGQLLWERTDLEDSGRPTQHSMTALPGDSQAVVLFEHDTKVFRVYKTADGSFVRQGRLANCFYVHQHFGRNLLYASDQTMKSVQLWDPLTDTVLFEAAQMAANVGISERETEFTVSDTFGKVRVIEGLTGKVKLQINLNPLDFQPPQPPPMVKSFTDGTRYYINVNRQLPVMSHSTFPSDAVFPNHLITGDLHAVDPTTSQVLWTRARLSQQNVVHLADYRLPFLVTLSRTRGQPRGISQTSLRVDVIDGQTGRTIANKANIFNDRLFLSDYDRDAGRLRFRGAVTQIHLDFGKNLNPPERLGNEFVQQ